MKVLTLAGTRPELIKLSEIIKKLDEHVDHVFVHTGQNYDYELGDIFYKDLNLRTPDEHLAVDIDLFGFMGDMFRETERILDREKPDAVVVLGDTNSCLGAYVAKRRKIPVFHLEAGNRSFDDNVPEEINRRMLDHISDINMVYTENARRNLLAEGIAADRIFLMGSPMREIISKHQEEIQKSKVLDELKLKPREYLVVSLHRDENISDDANFEELLETLFMLRHKCKIPIVVSTHPRLRKKLEENEVGVIDGIIFHNPFGFIDYMSLQANAKCVISDSGTISEESAICGFPAITVRNAMERPEAIDAGSIIMTGINRNSIYRCLKYVVKTHRPGAIPPDYEITNTSERVVRAILGYTGYVNRYVWHK